MHTVYTTRTSHQFLRHARACQSAHAQTRGACVCVLACMRACMRALGCAHKVTKTGTSPTFMPMHPSSHPRITLCSPTNIPFHIISIQFSVDYLHPPPSSESGWHNTSCKYAAAGSGGLSARASPIGNSYGSWSGSRVLQNFVPFSRVPVQCTLTMLPFCTWHAQRRVICADKRHVLLIPRLTNTYACHALVPARRCPP